MSIEKLVKLASLPNIADVLEKDQLLKIATDCQQGYELDKSSMHDWLERNKEAMKIAMQEVDKTSYPWQDAANVKYPLITQGAISFAARAYPQLIRNNKIVQCAVYGKQVDQANELRAKRVGAFMSWQLLVQSDTYEADTDKLLKMIAVIGTAFRKCYFNPITNRPVFELCQPDQIFVNANIPSLERARRISHLKYLYANEIIENQRLGLFSDFDVKELEGINTDTHDNDSPYQLVEQHTFIDLDGDGYKEPYIVVYQPDTLKICRIVSRFKLENVVTVTNEPSKIKYIKPDQYFTDFHYQPSPDGKFFSQGLGTLLLPLNVSINKSINQLLNSAELLNSQPLLLGGGAKINAKTFELAPGTINRVEGVLPIRDMIMNVPLVPPSPVVLNLLQLLLDSGKELANVTEILGGNSNTTNAKTGAVQGLVEQGLVSYSAAYKRVLASFKQEFEKLYYLNRDYLDINEYLTMTDDPQASADDFNYTDLNVRPVADPNLSSDSERLRRANAIYSMPEVDRRMAAMLILDTLDVDDYIKAALLPQPDPQAPPPPEVQKTLAETQLLNVEAEVKAAGIKSSQMEQLGKYHQLQMSADEAQLKVKEAEKKLEEIDSVVKLNQALAIKALADAHVSNKEATTPHETKPDK